MDMNASEMVQRGHNYCIVDEVDSILIDEARTPLIISGPSDDDAELYIKADNAAGEATLKEAGVEFDATPDVQSFKDKLDIPAYYDRYENESWFNRDLLNTILAAVN